MFKIKMVNLIILIVLSVVIGVAGQLFLKNGLGKIGEIRLTDLKTVFQYFLKMAANKVIILGLISCVISAFFWLVILSKTNLSLAYPLTGGLFYIGIIIVSRLFLREYISLAHLLGVIIILTGIIILPRAQS